MGRAKGSKVTGLKDDRPIVKRNNNKSLVTYGNGRGNEKLSKLEGASLKKRLSDMILSDKAITKQKYHELRDEYQLSEIALYRHVAAVCRVIEPEIIESFKWNFDRIFRKIQEKAEEMVDDSETHEDLRRSIDTMVKVIKERTDFLERFSIKNKIAEKVVVTHEIPDLAKLSEEILEVNSVDISHVKEVLTDDHLQLEDELR